MSLTLGHGPLSREPADANYQVEGPAHRLLFEDFPRRVRAIFGGEVILDTRHGKLLHETGLLPQLYVPRQDVRFDLLHATNHHTRCPYKGDAAYWSARAEDHVADNAAWAYPEPIAGVEWLSSYIAFYWDAMDAWFDEDEEVRGHLRDPYHRVDVRASTRHVRVCVEGRTVIETHRPKVLSETGLPNRYYIPLADVPPGLLEPSAKHTECPYKGTASYHTLVVGSRRIRNAAWHYPHPLEAAIKVRDHLCFYPDAVVVEVDGERI